MFAMFLAAIQVAIATGNVPSRLTATPTTLYDTIGHAVGGSVIDASGAFEVFKIEHRKFSPPIVLRGGAFAGIVLRDVEGVTLSGITITGSSAANSYGISVVKSSKIRIEKSWIGGAHRGVVLNEVTDFAIVKSRFDGIRSDGIDIALSHRGVISDNVMLNFKPELPIYADGKRVKDGDHADGIQLWSRPTSPPVSDITITGNSITGDAQCIFGGNHVRDGIDDGGFDRIVVEHNICRNAMPNGITLGNARESRIRYNDAAAIPGSRLLKTGQLVKTQVKLDPINPTSIACGNVVHDVPKSPAAQLCR